MCIMMIAWFHGLNCIIFVPFVDMNCQPMMLIMRSENRGRENDGNGLMNTEF
jgi:hypothetical protein